MILVDTSVWIDFLNQSGSKEASRFKELVRAGESLAINGIIEMEILQGIKYEKQMLMTKNFLSPFQYFPDTPKLWLDTAVEIYRGCRRSGKTVRKSIDCIIAAHALSEGLVVFHKDRDYESIKKSFRELRTLTV